MRAHRSVPEKASKRSVSLARCEDRGRIAAFAAEMQLASHMRALLAVRARRYKRQLSPHTTVAVVMMSRSQVRHQNVARSVRAGWWDYSELRESEPSVS